MTFTRWMTAQFYFWTPEYITWSWRYREGAAPTETNHQVAISCLIKWLLPVFFLHAFSKCLLEIHVRLQLICSCSEQHSRGQGNGFRLMVSILHDSISANLINTLFFFVFFLLNRQGSLIPNSAIYVATQMRFYDLWMSFYGTEHY